MEMSGALKVEKKLIFGLTSYLKGLQTIVETKKYMKNLNRQKKLGSENFPNIKLKNLSNIQIF